METINETRLEEAIRIAKDRKNILEKELEKEVLEIMKLQDEEKRLKTESKYTIDNLFKRASAYRSSTEYIKFVSFMSRFDHYSNYNAMLVYLQNKTVTFFGGESYWKKKFDRTIKEDARPYIILTPGGPIMLAYDIFETEGKLTPEELLEDGIGTNLFAVNGEISTNDFNKVLEEVRSWGIAVKTRPLSYFNAGYVTSIKNEKLEINLKEQLSETEQFGTLTHELAHVFLGHLGHEKIEKTNFKNPSAKPKTIKLLQRNNLSRKAEELEAETVSYLTMKRIGLETRSAEYLSGYITNNELLQEVNYEVIIKIADKIETLFTGEIKAKDDVLEKLNKESRLLLAKQKASRLNEKLQELE